ncbi:hypothetical protein BJY16_000284 [Actinoplanes octamycinicus]|uniref:EcsC family protein n=1 Tax=Actinoplanes octamycinicus TaxID=135948 RepID=A0A7W7GRB8_9ACTN|nr:hypothetical protein [Actinoplanes octamycinicus]MBB4736825.1 hypothetical protein [Actinoplanes octamycinicus]GIE60591.1 hypothetical protein Aoc01nite_59930 [Actinoplanes octamycinicus]
MSQPDRVPDSAAGADADEDLGRTVAALTADDLEPAGRRRLLGRLVGDVRRRGLGQAFKPKAALRWMADVVADVAPHVPVRNRETLRRHFPGMDDDALAERLIRNAARATAGVGAAGGGIASIEWAATPTLLSAPVLLSAETIGVVAIEMKLIGELHELYGQSIAGNGTERAVALVQSWAGQRGVNPLIPGVGVATVLGTSARRDLQKRLLHRFGRNLTSFGPMLTGAAVASYLNRRATRLVGEKVRDDLRKQLPGSPGRHALDD